MSQRDDYHYWKQKAQGALNDMFSGNLSAKLIFLARHNADLRCVPDKLLETKQGCKDLYTYCVKKKGPK